MYTRKKGAMERAALFADILAQRRAWAEVYARGTELLPFAVNLTKKKNTEGFAGNL